MSDTPKTSDGSVIIRDATEWFKHRSYDYRQFSDLEALGRRKRELGLTVSAVLPCRNVADTVGSIVDEIHTVNRQSGDNPLVEQILAVDADSPDGTAEAVDLWAQRVRGRITVGAAMPLSIPIPRSNLGGRSPPGPSLDNHIVLMFPNGEEDTNGDAIGTEVQRPLRGGEGHGRPAGHAGARVDHP